MSELKKIFVIEKFKGNTYSVEFYDGEKIYLHSSIISEYSLKDEIEIPEEALEEIIFNNDYRRAKERALYLLEYRDHSYHELNEKLSKNYSDEVCEAVMEKMVELRLINDRKYAEILARQLCEIKRYGEYRARFEMQKKGLDGELIDEMLAEYEDDATERLEALVEKKYSRYLVDKKGVNKVINALVRQGYNFNDIKIVLEKYLDEVED